MTDVTRRSLLLGSSALAAGAVLGGPSLLEWGKAWAAESPFKPEKGARLRILRYARFVAPRASWQIGYAILCCSATFAIFSIPFWAHTPMMTSPWSP